MQRTVISLFIVLLLAGCKGVPDEPPPMNPITLSDDEDTTKQELLKKIPLGIPIADAQSIMESNGGDCMTDSDGEGDYLYCYKEKSVELSYGRIWKIFIYFENESVTKIDVTTGLIGF